MPSCLDRDGFVLIPDVLDSETVAELLADLQQETESETAAASRRVISYMRFEI